jgi:hypothetical protein
MDYLFEEIRGFLSQKEQERAARAVPKKGRVSSGPDSIGAVGMIS